MQPTLSSLARSNGRQGRDQLTAARTGAALGSKGYLRRDMHPAPNAIGEAIPCRALAPVAHQQTLLDQGCKEGFERVRACADLAHNVAGGDTPLVAHIIQNLDGQFRQDRDGILLALHLCR